MFFLSQKEVGGCKRDSPTSGWQGTWADVLLQWQLGVGTSSGPHSPRMFAFVTKIGPDALSKKPEAASLQELRYPGYLAGTSVCHRGRPLMVTSALHTPQRPDQRGLASGPQENSHLPLCLSCPAFSDSFFPFIVHSFRHSFAPWFYSTISLVIHPLIHSVIQLDIHLSTNLLIHPSLHPPISPFLHPPTHPSFHLVSQELN